MKLKMRAIIATLIISICSTYVVTPIYAETYLPKLGDSISGFKVVDTREFKFINSELITFEHDKTGAKVIYCANDDRNRTFDISFKTPAINDRGTSHVFEHSTLSGSVNYPSETLFMKASSQTYNTSMNAYTYQNNTAYPVSSLSEQQLFALTDYYLDSVFNPLIYTDNTIIDREAWRYELASAEADLTISGTVYSEMQGHDNISTDAYYNTLGTIYPNSYASHNSGGDPENIPELTNDQLIEYHSQYYHPSNSVTVLYGELDCRPFLELLDKYFSNYTKKSIDINVDSYSPTEKYVEKTFEYPAPAGSDTKKQSTVMYAIECKGATEDDLVALNIALDAIGGDVYDNATRKMQGANVNYYIVTDGPEPVVMFLAENVNKEDAATFKSFVDNAISAVAGNQLPKVVKDAIVAAFRRDQAQVFEGSNIGDNISRMILDLWASTGDMYFAFDMFDSYLDAKEMSDKGDIERVTKNLLLGSEKRALVTTVPVAGLKDKEEAETKAKLAKVKSEMSPEKVNELVTKTKEYKEATEKNAQLDKELIEKISVIDARTLPEDLKSYNISDTKKDNVRYVTSEADIADIGQGSLLFDVSHIPEEDLDWLFLYCLVTGNTATEKYNRSEVSIRSARYADSYVDLEVLDSNSPNGFTPYLTFNWNGFADESTEIYDLANQILFKPDFKDTTIIKGLISQYVGAFGNALKESGYVFLLSRIAASTDAKIAYGERYNSLEFYEFLKKINVMLSSNPSFVTTNLDRIKAMLGSKSGAAMVYAGSKDSIAKNNPAADKFFASLPAIEKTPVTYKNLKKAYQDTALITDSTVNYNGIFAPTDILDVKYTGKTDVVFQFIKDRYLTSELRNKRNAYGVMIDVDKNGFNVMSYRDPNVKETFDVYEKIPGMIRDNPVTQKEVDNYILSVHSDLTMPRGELTDAFSAAKNYVNGVLREKQLEKIQEVKSTTPEDIEQYADVFDKMLSQGIKFTAGNKNGIVANEEIYDEILDPLGYNKITVIIDGDELVSEIKPLIVNDRTLVPLRPIFEALGMNVEWNDETKTVTATKGSETIKMTIGASEFYKNDAVLATDVPAQIIKDRTFVPVRVIAESLDCDVAWDGDTKTVTITSKK